MTLQPKLFRMILSLCLALMLDAPTRADAEGLITKASRYSVAEAVSRLAKVLTDAGLTIFATIDHAAAAQHSGLRMPPATLFVFGNPKGGTPMMLGAPTLAIDLPMKILVWEDAKGKPWVSYNTAGYVAKRHQLAGMDEQLAGLDNAIAKLASAVVEQHR